MKSFAAAALLSVASAAKLRHQGINDLDIKFMNHCVKYGLAWDTVEEYNYRKNIFANADAFIEQHNALGETWTAGHNAMSTWNSEEWAGLRNRQRTQPDPTKFIVPSHLQTSNQSFPASFDWLASGCVNPIQNQGQCGSCWAFSAIATIESANCIAKGQTGLYKMSEQQVVDCCGSRYDCAGCNGGW
jgi:KDEL-tailed cysteine endopeptidase